MVVRETIQMAESPVRSDLHISAPSSVEPLTVDVLGDRLGDSTVTLSADEPAFEVKQGGTRLSSQNLAVLTTGLKIMSSLRGHFVTKVKSVNGLSALSRRSEDDDGYCSRSSLDSPVQITRPDGASPTTEDCVETFAEGNNCVKNGRRSSCTSPLPSNGGEECGIRSCDGANDELKLDCNSQTVAAVASLDHCYLTADTASSTMPDGQLPSPVDASDAASQTRLEELADSPQSAEGVDDTADNSVPVSGRRNISIFVVPQPMPSTGLRWRARIIRADTTPSDDANSVGQSAQEITPDKLNVSVNPQGSTIQTTSSCASSSWLPLSAVAGTDSARVKSSVGAATHVASARRVNGYRQRLTVGSRLAALTATADSLSRQIARVAASSARTGNTYSRASTSGSGARADRRRAEYEVPDMSVRLHPLVDHDYGAFATFNAEVQSSIISTTTDGVSQLDWRSIRRHRPSSTAAARGRLSAPAHADSAAGQLSMSSAAEVRQKRKYCRRQQSDLVHGLGSSFARTAIEPAKPHQRVPGRKGRPPSVDPRRPTVGRKRPLQHVAPSSPTISADDSKSYVKIPGHYQDDFVYYATKRARGRPRKSVQDIVTSTPTTSSSAAPSRTTPVGGINLFDWYREMAQTDKSTRFGVPTSTAEADPPTETSAGWADTTPVDESAVADLVMDMLPASTTASTVCSDYSTAALTSTGDRSDMTMTEEDVCAMLRSLNEADLKMLESHLSSGTVEQDDGMKTGSLEAMDKVEAEPGADGNLSQYLNDCGRDSLLTLSQTSTSSGLLDVDEISDGDLLSADIGNMHIILSDLRTPTRDLRTTTQPVTSRSNLSALFDSPEYTMSAGGEFPACAASSSPSSEVERAEQGQGVSDASAVAPPELCVVNMFWNDLPGLMVDGREYVRLVDIHRQVLPAKDTGILKKRCYMLGLDVCQCSELQRDFLIRYMNAAKSKSTVVVSRPDAMHLIGFYVTPKLKSRAGDAEDTVVGGGGGPFDLVTAAQRGACTEQPQQQQRQQQSVPSSHRPPAQMTQRHRVSTLPALDTSVQPSITAESMEKSPAEGLKRSERLRDRRVHYADMVLGVHPRCGSADAEEDAKSGETGQRRHSAIKVDSSLPCRDLSPRSGTRTSSTERSLVDGLQHTAATVSSVRKSMSLRSSTDKQVDETTMQMEVSGNSLPQHLSGRRRPSVNYPIRAQQVGDGRAASTTGSVPLDSERHVAKPSTLPNRRHRGSTRHRRRMAARHRSKLRLLSSPPVETEHLPESAAVESESNVAEVSNPDCCKVEAETIDSQLVDDNRVSMPVRAHDSEVVKATDDVDATVLETVVDGSYNMDSQKSREYLTMAADVLNKNSALASTDLCASDTGSERPNEQMQVGNFVPVMHVDFNCRPGRRRHSQDGVVLLERYMSSSALCVRCCTCCKLFSVAEFMCHVHRRTSVDVGSVRRLGPRGAAGPEWREFQRRQAEFTVSISNTQKRAPAVRVVDQVMKENMELSVMSADHSTDNGAVVSMPAAVEKSSKTVHWETKPLPPPELVVDPLVLNTAVESGVDVCPSCLSDTVVDPVTCPGTETKPPAVPELRVTRSRSISIGQDEPFTLAAVGDQSCGMYSPPSSPRHRNRKSADVREVEAVPSIPENSALESPASDGDCGRAGADSRYGSSTVGLRNRGSASESVMSTLQYSMRSHNISESLHVVEPRRGQSSTVGSPDSSASRHRERTRSIGGRETLHSLPARGQSAAVMDGPASALRNSDSSKPTPNIPTLRRHVSLVRHPEAEHSRKRIRLDAQESMMTLRGSVGNCVNNSRVELRPHPAPHATAPK